MINQVYTLLLSVSQPALLHVGGRGGTLRYLKVVGNFHMSDPFLTFSYLIWFLCYAKRDLLASFFRYGIVWYVLPPPNCFGGVGGGNMLGERSNFVHGGVVNKTVSGPQFKMTSMPPGNYKWNSPY